MLISVVAGQGPESPSFPSPRPVGDLDQMLELATQLRDRACAPIENEQRHGVRMRLVRAQVLSIVDLLTEIVADASPPR